MARFNSDGFKAAMELADKESACAAWKHPAEVMEPTTNESRITDLADALSVVFGFIARGHIVATMHHRAWVWLHITRPNLLKGETVEAYAERTGVPVEHVNELIEEYHRTVRHVGKPGVA